MSERTKRRAAVAGRSRFELWVPAELLADVRRQAAARGLSASSYVRLRLSEAVRRDSRR